MRFGQRTAVGPRRRTARRRQFSTRRIVVGKPPPWRPAFRAFRRRFEDRRRCTRFPAIQSRSCLNRHRAECQPSVLISLRCRRSEKVAPPKRDSRTLASSGDTCGSRHRSMMAGLLSSSASPLLTRKRVRLRLIAEVPAAQPSRLLHRSSRTDCGLRAERLPLTRR